jgi:hypothetical protein
MGNTKAFKKYNFVVVITRNYKRYKIVKGYMNYAWARKKFENEFKKNQRIVFPQKYLSSTKERKVIPVKYHLLLMRKLNGDEKLVKLDRNEYGKLVEIDSDLDDWTILDKRDFMVEENFKIYGRSKRYRYSEIVREILPESAKYVRQITFVHNKLVIDYFSDMDVILCKNTMDAGRLHNMIMDNSRENGITNIIFFGEASVKNRTMLYERISKSTGKKIHDLYRKDTKS